MDLGESTAVTLDAVAELLTKAKRVLFITGAGLSADSGLRTYRGVGGLYEGPCAEDGLPIETIMSGAMFRKRPELTWKYFQLQERAMREARCNDAHWVIAAFERRLELTMVLTQNIDGLHRRAGSRNVVEIHGHIHDLYCVECGQRRRTRTYRGMRIPPRCRSCGGIERPDVVLFGERLSDEKVEAFMGEVLKGFDAIVSIGTTGRFAYIRAPVIHAQVYGWPRADINPERNRMTPYATHYLPMRAAEACAALWKRVTGTEVPREA